MAGDGWKLNGKIDYVRRDFSGSKCWIMVTNKSDCLIWELDSQKFASANCVCYFDEDVDTVIQALKKAKHGVAVLDIILSFIQRKHDIEGALKLAKKHLKAKFRGEFGAPSQETQGDGGVSRKRKSDAPSRQRDPPSSLRVSDSQINSRLPPIAPSGRPSKATPSESESRGSGARRARDPRNETPSVVAGSTVAQVREGQRE